MNGSSAEKISDGAAGLMGGSPGARARTVPARPAVVTAGEGAGNGAGQEKKMRFKKLKLAGEVIAFIIAAALAVAIAMASADTPALFSGLL